MRLLRRQALNAQGHADQGASMARHDVLPQSIEPKRRCIRTTAARRPLLILSTAHGHQLWKNPSCGAGGIAATRVRCPLLATLRLDLTDATACFDVSTCICACATTDLSGISFEAACCWGAGTMVGWLVSRTIRSGHCCAECNRMIDLSTCGSWIETAPLFVGQYQSATNSSARRELPTKTK
jgi:hypothetical protein